MKKVLLTLILSVVFGGTIFAQWYDNTENYNPNGYETYFNTAYTFTPGDYEDVDYPSAYLQRNGQLISAEDNWADFEVAAFVDDELRGFIFMTDLYVPDGYLPMFEGIFIYRTNSNEQVSFKVYDHSTGTEYDCTTNIQIVTGDDSNYYGVYDDPDGTSEESLIISFTAAATQTFTKNITGYGEGDGGYYFIASPIDNVDPTTVEGMTYPEGDTYGFFDLYSFDQEQGGAEWQNYKAENFNMAAGMGYLYANKNTVTLSVSGTPAGNPEVTLNKTEGKVWSGWNLVGNPFGVEAYIDRACYTLNGEGYVTINAGEPIGVMQGVLVEAEGDGETLTFTTEAPAKSANLSLNVTSESKLVDRATLCFGEGRNLDKITFRQNDSKLYMTQDGNDYAVLHTEGMGEMPVSFKAEKNGSYTMSFTSQEVSFNYLHLIDNMTGADVDLLANPSYTFDARTSDYASRFRLVFATGSSNEDSFAFFSNGNLVVNNDGDATLQVVDVMGRILSSESINGCASVNVKAAPGVYMVRLVNGDNMKVQKVVVK